MKSHSLPMPLAVCVPLVLLVGCATRQAPDGFPEYTVQPARRTPVLNARWNGPPWRWVETLPVDQFLPHSTENLPASGHRPVTRARVIYDAWGVYVHFRVKDKYVLSRNTEYYGRIWEDAAVEFFVQPKPERGYFNFEINCGGAMRLSYHEHPDWTEETPRKSGKVPWELASRVRIARTMPRIVDPEIEEPTTWFIEFHIPFALFEEYVGPIGPPEGQVWRANFYKIAESNSHPHFASWSPIREGVNFHSPQFFGILRFAE